jgi:hypothetical protein
MPKPLIAAEKIFEHAECFYRASAVLRSHLPVRLRPDHFENIHAAVTLTEPLIVLDALTSELFLKCLICIETGRTVRIRRTDAALAVVFRLGFLLKRPGRGDAVRPQGRVRPAHVAAVGSERTVQPLLTAVGAAVSNGACLTQEQPAMRGIAQK